MQNQLELIEIDKLAREFLLLDVADNQRGLVASVAQSYADALFPPKYETGIPKPWIRGVLRNGVPAAFLMCAEPTPEQEDPWIWRLLVDKSHQGFGVGSFAVQAAIIRYRELQLPRVLVSWKPTENNPSGFYRKLGFVETGENIEGEVVASFNL
jgi:diamine N-acetyltransferase